MKKNCIVAQSGGPTAAINASLAGVIAATRDCKNYHKLYGAIHGIQGVLKEDFLDLTNKDDEFIDRLIKTPAMYLGSCRCKLPDISEELCIYKTIFKIFEKFNIGSFFYIGGNDSMDTVDKLSCYADLIHSDIQIIGIPKTIDNDLLITDHTPGFGSAAKYVANTVKEIAYDTYIYDIESVTIVEVMGRDAGWLTASSVLARTDYSLAPHMIYLPEVAFEKEQFICNLQLLVKKYKNVIVVVSEGIRDCNGCYISSAKATNDKFGHVQLSGAGKTLEYLVKEKLGIKVCSIEINVLQRCASHLASSRDLEESYALGQKAVSIAQKGENGKMVIIKRMASTPYSYMIDTIPVSEVANQIKSVPLSWITDNHYDVTSEMIDYLQPLVSGKISDVFENGIVNYLDLSHLVHKRSTVNI